MNKAKLNYMLDAVIGVAFVLSAVTGMAFLRMGSGGYQGGRNPNFQTALLGISRAAWSDLHTWVSLVMITGVVVHLVLHWKWIVCVSKQVFSFRPRRDQERCELAA